MPTIGGFSSPLLLGFEQIESLLERIGKTANDSYPPYNIERSTSGKDQQGRWRISLAVAGFDSEDLQIVLENNQLTIAGKMPDEGSKTYLHRGIAARQFKRSFILAECMEVTGAELENGLLHIELIYKSVKPTTIQIPINNKR